MYFFIEKQTFSMLSGPSEIDDSTWFNMKLVLRKSVKGRELLEWAENDMKSKSITLFETFIYSFRLYYC